MRRKPTNPTLLDAHIKHKYTRMAVTPPKKGRGWDLANTNIQEWIKLFQGVGVMKVYISAEHSELEDPEFF